MKNISLNKTTKTWHVFFVKRLVIFIEGRQLKCVFFKTTDIFATVPVCFILKNIFRFERMAEGLFPNLVKDCPAYLRHKMCLISPTILRQNSIPYNKVTLFCSVILIYYRSYCSTLGNIANKKTINYFSFDNTSFLEQSNQNYYAKQ